MRLQAYSKSRSPYIGASISYGVGTGGSGGSSNGNVGDGSWKSAFESIMNGASQEEATDYMSLIPPIPNPLLNLPKTSLKRVPKRKPVFDSVSPASIMQPGDARNTNGTQTGSSVEEIVQDDFLFQEDSVNEQTFAEKNKMFIILGGFGLVAILAYASIRAGKATR